MSFWNNPENNSLKALLVVLGVVVVGGFIYYAKNDSGESTGRVISASSSALSSAATSTTTVTPLGTTGSMTTGTTTTPGTATGTTTSAGTTGTTTSGAGGTSGSTGTTGTGVGTTGAIQGTTGKGGTGTDPTGGETTGRDPSCDSVPPVALTATQLPPGPVPTAVYVGPSLTSPSAPGHWLNFSLMNPTACPVVVSKATINLDTNDLTAWPPVQHVKLMNAGVQVGGELEVPGSGMLTTGPANLVFVSAPGFPFAVTIAPGATEVFRVTSASQNVNANEYGPVTPPSTSASGTVTPGTGTPVYFSMQLTEFFNTNSISGTTNDQSVSSGTAPATILTPHVNIYN